MSSDLLRAENESLREQNARLVATIEEIRANITEPEEVIRAIQEGEIDALVVREGISRAEIYCVQRFAALRENEERFRLMVEGVKDHAIYMLDPEGRVTHWNNGAAHLYGYAAEEVVGQDSSRFFDPEDVASGLLQQRLLAAQVTGQFSGEGWRVRKDGTRFWANEVLSALSGPDGELRGFVKVIQNLTERKRSESLLAAVSDSVSDGIIGITERGIVQFFNLGAEKQFGYTRSEIVGQNIKMLISEPHQSGNGTDFGTYLHIGDAKFIGTGSQVVARRKDCTTFPVELNVSGFFLDGVRHFTGVVRDITEQQRAVEQIRASLREKEVLLKEIHHRVKNNLQIVSALLDLQSEHTQDRLAQEMFQESRGRVRSMAMIHERLYRSQDLARVDVREYISQLADDLYHAYKVSSEKIALDVDVDALPLPIDTAITCGLFLNELLSNCLKHAFTGASEGRIRVSLRGGDDGTIVLTVADNGAGFPAGFDIRTAPSFGMRLVNIFAEQLCGQVEMKSNPGTEITVRFPDPQ